MDPTYVVGALVGTIYVLTEVIKRRSVKRNGHVSGFNPRDRQQLETLFKQHQPLDPDGTPVWYVPRSTLDKQATKLEEILGELRDMNSYLSKGKCPYQDGS